MVRTVTAGEGGPKRSPRARLAALVQSDAEHHGQLLVNCLLHRGAHVLVDQIAQRHRLLLMRELQLLDTVLHGVFLR